ncbi:MAG TPA: hypothetical protein VFT39_15815 [Vicinamibacterales bacterium]|nr:hypothetical protein [Vicinamibacterales bacterium]
MQIDKDANRHRDSCQDDKSPYPPIQWCKETQRHEERNADWKHGDFERGTWIDRRQADVVIDDVDLAEIALYAGAVGGKAKAVTVLRPRDCSRAPMTWVILGRPLFTTGVFPSRSHRILR